MTAARSACPHGGQAVLPCWKKLGLGPMRRIPCPACGKPISAAWLPAMAMLALSALMVPAVLVLDFMLFGSTARHWPLSLTICFVAIALPLTWAWCRFVPLVARRD